MFDSRFLDDSKRAFIFECRGIMANVLSICGIYVYPPSGLLTNVIYSGPSNSLSDYWRVRLLSVELRLFRRLSL